MSEPYIWNGLNRTITDPTTIDEAIAEGVKAHNDDPESHLGAGQALESHRAAEIIDHLAESVVNDKIQRAARAYVAIVGSGAEGDFDTIQSAVAHAISLGGGTIFIMPGDHYLAGEVLLPANINLRGADPEACKIHGNYANGNYFRTVEDTATGQIQQTFENIHFINDGGGIFSSYGQYWSPPLQFGFTDCQFSGNGKYVDYFYGTLRLTRCKGTFGGETAFSINSEIFLQDCSFSATGAIPGSYLLQASSYEPDSLYVYITGGLIQGSWSASTPIINTATLDGLQLRQAKIWDWDVSTYAQLPDVMIGCQIHFKGTVSVTWSTTDVYGIWIGNEIAGHSTKALRVTGSKLILIGNNIANPVEVIGAGNTIYGNMPTVDFKILANTATATTLGQNTTAQLTPTSSRTLNTTVPPAGTRCTLIVLTSGTTSYTLTFGGGFKSVGTLATGTTNARRFLVSFVSDGTYLIETGRVGPIA